MSDQMQTQAQNYYIIHVASQHPDGPNYVSSKLFRTQMHAQQHVMLTEMPYLRSYVRDSSVSYECTQMDSQCNDGVCVQYELDQEIDIIIQIILGVVC